MCINQVIKLKIINILKHNNSRLILMIIYIYLTLKISKTKRFNKVKKLLF